MLLYNCLELLKLVCNSISEEYVFGEFVSKAKPANKPIIAAVEITT